MKNISLQRINYIVRTKFLGELNEYPSAITSESYEDAEDCPRYSVEM